MEGCGKSYCDARSLRRHQDNHHAGSSAGASGAPGSTSSSSSSTSAPVLEQLHSPSGEAASAQSAGVHLFSDLSCGAGDLLGLSYPASSSSSGFVQASPEYSSAGGGVDSAGWASAAVDPSGLDPFGQASPSCGLTNGYHLSSGTDDGSFQALVTDASAVGWTDPCVQDVVGSISNGHLESSQRPASAKVKNEKSAKSARKVALSTPNSGAKSKKSKAQKNSANNGHNLMTNGSAGSKLKADTNDGLTSQQLELIQEIMRQTQEQHRLLQEEQQQLQHKTHPKQPQQQPQLSIPAQPASGTPVKSKKSVKVKWTGGSASGTANGSANTNNGNSAAPASAESNASGANCSSLAADCGRPVECNVCQRRFKNTPALNGHMRLHGGFLKKDSECKKPDKKDPNTPPLQTASVSIRALIEEKIIQRRNLNASGTGMTPGTSGNGASGGITSNGTAAASVTDEQPSGEEDVNLDGLSTPTGCGNQQQDPMTDGTESNPDGCKLEPESYFEGSLLALSPVSLHRALEGDADEHLTGSDGSGHQHSLHVGSGSADHFFSTSSSSSASSVAAAAAAAAELNDVPLLDDAVFHQVSAAAASALLSDISSLDLQSYMDASGSHGADGYSECLSQYLATTTGPVTPSGSTSANSGGNIFSDGHYTQQTQQQQTQQSQSQHPADSSELSYYGGYNTSTDGQTNGGTGQGQQSADVQRFSFDPSPLPSTPLSSLCSPQYMVDGFPAACSSVYSDAGQYDSQPHGSASSAGLLLPTPSPYTPSPSPVSPVVVGPHLHRFQQQHPQQTQQPQTSNYYANGNGFAAELHPSTNNFMIECANTVLYNMESGLSSGWDTAAAAFVDAHALDLNSIQQTLPPPQYQPQQTQQVVQASIPADHKPLKVKNRLNKNRSTSVSSGGENSGVKKARASRAKKWSTASAEDEPEAKIRRTALSQRQRLRDELDELLSDPTALTATGSGRFASAMRTPAIGASQHYVPPPMLDPKRQGGGLYWNLVKDTGSAFQVSTVAPPRGRINVGKEFQCTALPRCKKDASLYKEKEAATLCWSGNLDVDPRATSHLLAWSQSANVPGPKRSQEQVLELLSRFRGDVQVTPSRRLEPAKNLDFSFCFVLQGCKVAHVPAGNDDQRR